MSGAGNREQVFPTRMTLGVMKSKLKGAQQGHSLLKRKSEALTKRFRDITQRIDDAKRKMGRVMQTAAFSLAEVQYAKKLDSPSKQNKKMFLGCFYLHLIVILMKMLMILN